MPVCLWVCVGALFLLCGCVRVPFFFFSLCLSPSLSLSLSVSACLCLCADCVCLLCMFVCLYACTYVEKHHPNITQQMLSLLRLLHYRLAHASPPPGSNSRLHLRFTLTIPALQCLAPGPRRRNQTERAYRQILDTWAFKGLPYPYHIHMSHFQAICVLQFVPHLTAARYLNMVRRIGGRSCRTPSTQKMTRYKSSKSGVVKPSHVD